MIIVTCLAALIATIALGVIFYFCYLFYCWKKQQNINTGLLAYYHSGYSFLKIRAIPIEKWEQIKAIIASEYALDKDRFQLETFYSIPGEVLTARIDAKIIQKENRKDNC